MKRIFGFGFVRQYWYFLVPIVLLLLPLTLRQVSAPPTPIPTINPTLIHRLQTGGSSGKATVPAGFATFSAMIATQDALATMVAEPGGIEGIQLTVSAKFDTYEGFGTVQALPRFEPIPTYDPDRFRSLDLDSTVEAIPDMDSLPDIDLP